MVENMSGCVCPKCGHDFDMFGTGGAKKMAKEMEVEILGKIWFHKMKGSLPYKDIYRWTVQFVSLQILGNQL